MSLWFRDPLPTAVFATRFPPWGPGESDVFDPRFKIRAFALKKVRMKGYHMPARSLKQRGCRSQHRVGTSRWDHLNMSDSSRDSGYDLTKRSQHEH